MKMDQKEEVEMKGMIEELIKAVRRLFNLDDLGDYLDKTTKFSYQKGLDKAEIQFNMNFVPNEQTVKDLQHSMKQNIADQGLEIISKIDGEVTRWKLNNEDVPALKRRLTQALKSSEWDWKAKRIIRTETLRANNMGALDGALQSPVKTRKWLDVTQDARTSDICHKEHSKYGSPEEAIPIDKEFVVTVKNKTYRSQAPPFHPNCRSVLRLIQDEDWKILRKNGGES